MSRPSRWKAAAAAATSRPTAKQLVYTDNPDPVPAISTSPRIWTLDLGDPAAKPVQISTSAGGNFNPAYSPDGKYIAWRSQARAGYESDKFRLVVYDRAAKTIKDLLPNWDNWVDEFAWAPDSHAFSTLSLAAQRERPGISLPISSGMQPSNLGPRRIRRSCTRCPTHGELVASTAHGCEASRSGSITCAFEWTVCSGR